MIGLKGENFTTHVFYANDIFFSATRKC